MTTPYGDKICPHCGGSGVIDERVHYKRYRGDNGELLCQELERHPLPPKTPPMYYYNSEYPYPAWIVEAHECSCKVMARQHESLIKSVNKDGVPSQYDQFGFDDFADQAEARTAALEFVQNDLHVSMNGLSKAGLLFVGATGVHKTCLAYMIYRECLARGIVGQWWLAAKLIQAEQDTYDDEFTGDRDAFIKACRSRLLIVDDLGDKRPSGTILEISPNRQEIMFRLFEHREAKGLPTICTTNLKKQELYQHFGDRVTSRILGLCHIIPMTGKDSRVYPTGA